MQDLALLEETCSSIPHDSTIVISYDPTIIRIPGVLRQRNFFLLHELISVKVLIINWQEIDDYAPTERFDSNFVEPN